MVKKIFKSQSQLKNLSKSKRTNGNVCRNRNASEQSITYFQMFRYSTITERFFIFVGIILAALGSLGTPYSIIIYGEFTSLLVDRTVRVGTSTPTIILDWFGGGQILTNGTIEENRLALIKDSQSFGIGNACGALFQFILVLIGVDLLNYVAVKQISRIRILFFESLLKQDMTWYDMNNKNTNFASKMTDDLDKLKEGIGEKVAVFTFLIGTFVSCIMASLFYGWKLTLVVLSCTPIIILSTAFVAKIQSSLTQKELKSYSLAGAVAEEIFSGIRTVVAFSGENKECKRYSERLVAAEKTGERKGFYSGLGSGIMWFIVYCSYALALWYGVQLILDDRGKDFREYTPAVLVIILFGVLMGAQNLGFTSPHFEAFSTACGAATTIFSVIDRKSAIDSMDTLGLKPKAIEGHIQFENINFKYPARNNVNVLNGLNLTIEVGQTVALVGPSGCGKSTCLQLLQRFYDPFKGHIKLDGMEINKLNVGWLRSQIGVVGQEPVLFATTIGENIRYGNPMATKADIEQAAKIANCHNFISKLPKGYETMVGEKGAQVSGGQKQRIAIARAIIRNPKILLLDEATSALDPTSERRVQEALEIASKGRTTLVVSHRLSTVTNADKIVYVQNGVVAEQGTHDELMLKKGLYYDLVNMTKTQEELEKREINVSPVYKHNLFKQQTSVLSNNLAENICNNEETDVNEKYDVSIMRVMKLNAPEWKYILIGALAAIIHGSSMPIFAILFGEFYGILSIPDPNEVKEKSIIFSFYFIALGVIAGIGTLLQFYMFNIAGVRLTSRLRKTAFKTIVSQEIGWFDEKKNAVGALCARLAGDCANVQGATGSRIGSMVQAISTLVIGIIISFVFSWKLTLVTMVTIPVVLGSIFFESRYMAASTMDEKLAIEKVSQMAVEAISNIRTVTSLGQEKFVLERYSSEIEKVTLACRKKTRFRGTVFSLGQAAPIAAYGLGLFYGGTLVANDGLEYKNIIKVSEALIFGAWVLGQALAYAPNVNAALISAGRLINLFERVPKLKNPAPIPYNTLERKNGQIKYDNVKFNYPTRPEVPVLQGINLDIPKGSTVALVGPSGCGKSTCIQLILRYYDPDSGSLKLSDISTKEFNLDTIRSQLGLVSQEPVLFDLTIAENIAYGNNFHDVSKNDIIEAARKANIHDFIINLPLGYETSLGNKGAQLSGGQKQRIAIARALVRNPSILILDEATSALDMQSEKIVQDALDAARAGRTCITIAHRLTTIQNADIICVVKSGVIIEKGNHEHLLKLNGIYAELYSMQQIH